MPPHLSMLPAFSMVPCFQMPAKKEPPQNRCFAQLFFLIAAGSESRKEVVVGAAVESAQRNDHADADVQLSGLIFCIGGPADVAAAALQLGAQLLLGEPVLQAQSAQIVAHSQISPQLLFHPLTPFDQYWLQPSILYAIMGQNIVRDTGQEGEKDG